MLKFLRSQRPCNSWADEGIGPNDLLAAASNMAEVHTAEEVPSGV
jgi:hypothetical protein